MQPVNMQMILTRTSHPQLEEWSSFRPHSPRAECCAALRRLSCRHAMSAPWRTRRASNNYAAVHQGRLTHSTIRPCSRRRVSEPGPPLSGDNGVLIGRTPSARRLHREPLLPYLPCSPSVTCSVLIPRPAALGVLLRLMAPCGFRLSENLYCNERKKISRTFRKRHACGTWERGTLASLRARVTRGQFGQIQTGANRCHSTPTKSS
jgi:hypothetical protein